MATGLKYAFVNSNIHKLAAIVLYLMLLPYVVLTVGNDIYAAITVPVFNPNPGISELECYNEYNAYYNAFYEWWYTPYFLYYSYDAYFIANVVLSLVGIVLIYWATKRITSTAINVQTEWTQYILHVMVLTLLAVFRILTQYKFNSELYQFIINNSIETLTSFLLCYIVWRMSRL